MIIEIYGSALTRGKKGIIPIMNNGDNTDVLVIIFS